MRTLMPRLQPPDLQDESEWLTLAGVLSGLLRNCSTAPRLACSAVGTGLLSMALDCAGRDAAVQDPRRQSAVSSHAQHGHDKRLCHYN